MNGPEDVLGWDAIGWRAHEQNVVRLRRRIFKATREQDWAKVRSLPKMMLRSWSNTLVSVRQVLVALLFTPLLVAASSGGCDCEPRLPETSSAGCGDSRSSYEKPDRDLTTNVEKIADRHGYTAKQVRKAIHKVKDEAGLKGKNVLVDVKTGEVYPRTPRGGPGDPVGNIFDHLPLK